MKSENREVIRECTLLSIEGKVTFGDVVKRLMGVGVERYHADYSRHERTYYMPDGESVTEAAKNPAMVVAEEFSAAGVQAAIRATQRGEIMYPEFVRQTMAAGCVGYFVHITGRQVLYLGRKGDMHVEKFPTAKT